MKDPHKLFKEFKPNSHIRIGVGNCIELTNALKTKYKECDLIHHPSKQLQCRATRCLLDQMLGRESKIEYDQFSAPYIKNSDLHISISHSSDYVAIAIGTNTVGIDIQKSQEKILLIADKFVTKEELRPEGKDSLINWLHWQWSAKESLFKVYKKGGIDFKSMLKIQKIEDANSLRFDGKGNITKAEFSLECSLHFIKLEDYYLVCAF